MNALVLVGLWFLIAGIAAGYCFGRAHAVWLRASPLAPPQPDGEGR